MELDFSKIDAVVAELEHSFCPIFVTRRYVANSLGRERLHDVIEDELADYLQQEHKVTLVRYEEKGFYFIKRELSIGSDSDLAKQRAYRKEQAWDKKNERKGLSLLASLKKGNVKAPSITWESCQASLNESLGYIRAILAHESVPDAQIASMLEEYEYDINRINSFVCCLFEEDEFESDEDEFKDDFRELESQIEGMSESFCETLHQMIDPDFEYIYARVPGEYALEPVFLEISAILDSYRDIVFNIIDFKVQYDLDNT